MPNSLKNYIYETISGKIEVRHGKVIQSIANHLRLGGEKAREQAQRLKVQSTTKSKKSRN